MERGELCCELAPRWGSPGLPGTVGSVRSGVTARMVPEGLSVALKVALRLDALERSMLGSRWTVRGIDGFWAAESVPLGCRWACPSMYRDGRPMPFFVYEHIHAVVRPALKASSSEGTAAGGGTLELRSPSRRRSCSGFAAVVAVAVIPADVVVKEEGPGPWPFGGRRCLWWKSTSKGPIPNHRLRLRGWFSLGRNSLAGAKVRAWQLSILNL